MFTDSFIRSLKGRSALLTIFIILQLFHFQALGEMETSFRWELQTGGPIHGSAVVDETCIYIGSGDAHLYALDKTTGEVVWSYLTSGCIRSTPAIWEQSLFIYDQSGTLTSLARSTGQLLWKRELGQDPLYDRWDYYDSSPVVSGGRVYIGGGKGITCLDAGDGELIWQFQTGGCVHAIPLIGNGFVYVGSFDGYFYALDSETGECIWKFDTQGNDYFPLGEVACAAAFYGDEIVFGSRDYRLYALNSKTGECEWSYFEPNSWIIATPLGVGNEIYVGTSDTHRFLCLDGQKHDVSWALALNMRVYGRAVLYGNDLLFGCFNGKFYQVDRTTGQVKQAVSTRSSRANYANLYKSDDTFREGFEIYGPDLDASERAILSLGSILSDPCVDGDTVYFGDTTGMVMALPLCQ